MRGPFAETADGYVGRVPGLTPRREEAEFVLLKNRALIGPVRLGADDTVVIAPVGHEPDASDVFHIAEGIVRTPETPFVFGRGRMWIWSVPDLAGLADDVSDPPNASPVFLFEDGLQLPWPRALHADIERHGAGRFSHWGRELLFAPIDNVDPNGRRERFSLVIATEALSDDQNSRLRGGPEGTDG